MRLILAAALLLAACGEQATLPVDAGIGANPKLPEPKKTLLPTVNIADVVGWSAGAKPTAAPGYTVELFADGLDHPRWMHVLSNGDVLVAESKAPPKEKKGLRDRIAAMLMSQATGGGGSANRITLLRDANGDGRADARLVLVTGLFSPFGIQAHDGQLYVANADAVVRFPFRVGETRITTPGEKLTDLPGGPRNHHWTKNILLSPDGAHLYAAVGSNSNVGENGMDEEKGRAAIWEINRATGAKRLFATGLRNPVGLAWEPSSGALWTSVNERDEIGSDLVPDYMTSVRRGGFYGWPYSYYGGIVDERVEPQRPDLVAKAIKPDYALGAHTASLGLTFAHGGAYIGQHGSWNRKPPSGYKVIFVPFANGKPSGPAQDVLTGFRVGDKAYGRPAGVAVDHTGAILVADDTGNRIWRVVRKSPAI
jgi:glucose/arabinose dehydrogenase